MSFQWIFDRAESISIDKKALVGQTITRNQTVRAVSRGAGLWKFTVKLPDGLKWSEIRPFIEQIENLNRFTSVPVQLTDAGYRDWLTNYRGDCISDVGFNASIVKGSDIITLTSNPAISSGYKFKTGDLIQIGSIGDGRVYTVKSDVAFNSNVVTLNRPLTNDTNPNIDLTVGSNVAWRVLCTDMPTWTIFARDQVSWSGSFTFIETQLP